MIKKFKSYRKEMLEHLESDENLPILDEIILPEDNLTFSLIKEGKIIKGGRFGNNIRIDQPTHGVGQTHAHVMGRKGKEIVTVNLDGTGSHGTKGRLHQKDADVLRNRGFKIKPDNVVEWNVYPERVQLLID